LARRPSHQYLVLDDALLARQDPARFGRAWAGLMGLSLLWGLAAMNLYGVCWRVFGDYTGIPLVPAAALLAGAVLGPYRRAVVGLAQMLGRDRPAQTSVAAAAVVACLGLLLLGLRSWNPNLPYNRWLAMVRPETLFRALLLAPLWGGWSMLVTCQLRWGRLPGEAVTASVARGCGALAAPGMLAAMTVVTIVYFNHLPWTQVSIAATGGLAGVLAGLLTVSLERAITRRALLGANLLTQMAFLLAYLANR
jgi:hypothetical protein